MIFYNFRFYVVVFALCFIFSLSAFAQNDPQNPFMATQVLPPAPNASQLGKFGELQPGLFTGAAQYQISLYTLQTRDIKVPINLSYSSNGVKVDEIASRVGINWVLNLGGVINRTVYDVPDERGTFTTPPNSFDSKTTALFNYLKTAVSNDYTGMDTQPDIFNFNFNGISGKFILDSLKRPVLLEKTNLKIEPDFSGTGWNFKITDKSGMQYYFGGSVATEKTKTYPGNGSECGRNYGTAIPTAWYLNKIKSPKGDSVVFKYTAINSTYKTGVSESLTRTPNSGSGNGCPNGSCGIISNDIICASNLITDGVVLTEVDFDQGKITIDNITRGDLEGDVLVSNINIYKNGQTEVLKQFSLSYLYSNSGTNYVSNNFITSSEKSRPFLWRISEKDKNSVTSQNYGFTYEDINGLPPRLSFAQDYLGYFNGKNNSKFVPASIDANIKSLFPINMGDRNFDSLYAKKGLLTKIIYPTGGSDSLIYEPHKNWGSISIPAPGHGATVIVTGTGIRSPVTKSEITSPVLSTVVATFTLRCDGLAGSGTYDTLHQFAEAQVVDNTTGIEKANFRALPFETKSTSFFVTVGHTYTVTVTANGSVIKGAGSLGYEDGTPTSQPALFELGGMRVAKIITYDPVSAKTLVKRFYYAPLSDLTASSGSSMYSSAALSYYKEFKTITSCETFCTYKQGSSTSMYNLFVYTGSNVVYNSVIEGLGENFENGGIEHLFTVRADIPAHVAIGNDINGAPLTNLGWNNGLELNTNYFKKNPNVSYTKKVSNHFVADSRAAEIHKGYVISREYTLEHPILVSSDFDQFDVLEYQIRSYWVYNDTTTTTDYDALQNPIYVQKTVSGYDNPMHFNLTRSQLTKSDGKLLTVFTTYPQDYSNSNTAISNLIGNHVVDVPIETVKYSQDAGGGNTTILSGFLRTYKLGGAGLVDSVYGLKVVKPIPLSAFKFSNASMGILPVSGIQSPFLKSQSYEPRINDISYDAFGNLQQQHIENGPDITYLWGYNSTYPIAQLKNTTYQDVLAVLGQSTIDQLASGNPGTDAQVKLLLNPLYTDTRFKNAQVTTFTYNPLIGMTSMTDAKGQTTSYEYDSFQRLINVKDKDGNIINHNDYHYQGQ